MTFLPVVERELRVASRRRATHWLRFFAALLVVGVGFILLIGSGSNVPSHRLAKMVFQATSLIGFGFCLLAGTFLTADCLCSERRDGTLGLLFLTDLRGYDVVLGKLAATSAVAVYAVLAILPMLGLPLLMGGVTPGEFGRMCLTLLATLLLSLASGMLASAVSHDTRAAMLGSFTIMLALTAGLFLAGWAIWAVTRFNPLSSVMIFSPLGAYTSSFDAGPSSLTRYWTTMWILGGLALAQLAAASWLLPHVWQEARVEKKRHAITPGQRQSRRVALIENAFTWLATRDGFPRATTRLILGLLLLVWIGFFLASYGVGRVQQTECVVTCLIMAFGLHVVGKGLVAVQASRRFSEDRASGVMELLLVTPLRPEAILEGQWAALRRQFAWLLRLLALLNLLLLFRFLVPGQMHVQSEDQFTFALILLGGIALLYADFRALGWIGMWLGLRGFKHHRAVLGALLRVLIAPWVMIFLFVFLTMQGGASREAVTGFFLFWAFLSLVMDVVQSNRHKSALTAHFRRLAAGDAGRDPDPTWFPEPRGGPGPDSHRASSSPG